MQNALDTIIKNQRVFCWLLNFSISSDLCVGEVLNGMVVPRAASLITHVKDLEGDLEPVPRENV